VLAHVVRCQKVVVVKLVRSLGLVIAAFALAAGCGSPADTGQQAGQLWFTAKTVDGKDFSGRSLAGKPAVLWIW
jgi:hypothetical protein